MSNLAHYFVTDIECDGLAPGESSMLSFATVAVRQDGHIAGEFEAVLKRLPDSSGDPKTMSFWKTQPEAWKAATQNPEPPEEVMPRFADWVRTFSGSKAFASRPLMLDGPWIDYYLRKFANTFVLDDPFRERKLFTASPLDIGTYISGLFNRPGPHSCGTQIPEEWLGNHPHTHRAIDDARGYASLLSKLLMIANEGPDHPQDFIGPRL